MVKHLDLIRLATSNFPENRNAAAAPVHASAYHRPLGFQLMTRLQGIGARQSLIKQAGSGHREGLAGDLEH